MTCDEECVRNIVKQELTNFQPQSKKGTKKKSNWNIFLADCTKRQPNGTPLGDRAKACSIEYKELKKNGSLDNIISRLSTNIMATSTDTNNKDSNNNDNADTN